MVSLTKAEFITRVLKDYDQIVAFVTWLNSDNPVSKATKFTWDNTITVNLEDEFVYQLISSLVPSVLSKASLDRMNSAIERQRISMDRTVPIIKRYVTPPSCDIAWINSKIGEASYNVEPTSDGGLSITTSGTLPEPAMEVI
jgi:hypothetical protein